MWPCAVKMILQSTLELDQGRYLKRCSQCGHSMSPARYQDNPSEEKEAERRGAPSPMTRGLMVPIGRRRMPFEEKYERDTRYAGN